MRWTCPRIMLREYDGAYIRAITYVKEDTMAKFMQFNGRVINLENVDYIDLGTEENPRATLHFGSQTTIQLTGDEATKLWEVLEEENILGTSCPRP